ncbi:MAG TPA: RNA methyltransferase [Anaerovoracaceae bacterium]|nr:RNA methyltransferase [Anaerovoracaceae bacterium]
MKRITSDDNRIYKEAAQLKLKKYRDERQKYLIEGPNLLREALQNGGEIEMILVSEDYGGEGFDAGDLFREGIPMAAMPPGLFRKLSDTETPQGIMAVVKKRVYRSEEFFSSASCRSNIIVLDRLQDPGNIGTILRTADAAGYLGAIFMKGTADIYSPKVARAAAGSLFRLPVLTAETPGQAVQLLKQHGKTVVCTAPGGNRPYYDAGLAENAAVVIGNEGNGVSEEFLELSDFLVTIPMEGTVESLNAAAAAAILMYESVRQRNLSIIIKQ